MNKKLTVLATFKAKNGQEKALEAALRELIKPTLEEEGCLNYDLHQSIHHENEFMFHENWLSLAAHAKHNSAPPIEAWRKKKDALLLEDCIVTSWQAVD